MAEVANIFLLVLFRLFHTEVFLSMGEGSGGSKLNRVVQYFSLT